MSSLNKVRVFVENFLVDCKEVAEAMADGIGYALVVVAELATASADLFLSNPWLAPTFFCLFVFGVVACY